MRTLIEQFSNHILESIQLANNQPLPSLRSDLRQVVISGLGGSGIGGTMVADLARPYAKWPVLVNKEYSIPACVNAQTLFIASSYSGGTEETLEAVHHALAAGAQVICITSGGKLADLAREKGLGLRLIPGGNPPRAAFGYSFSQLVDVFEWAGLLPSGTVAQLGKTAQWLGTQTANIDALGKTWAEKLYDKMPIIYCDAAMEGVAVRFRQQINENGKMLCWHHVVPEMNHNELVGWTTNDPKLAVIFLRNSTDYVRNQTRIDINKTIVGKYTPNVHEMWSEGETNLDRMLYLVHLGDFVSLHLSDLRGVDVTEVRVIDFLKSELARQA